MTPATIEPVLSGATRDIADSLAQCFVEGADTPAVLDALGITLSELQVFSTDPAFMRAMKQRSVLLERHGVGIKAQAQRELRSVVSQIGERLKSDDLSNTDLTKFGEMLLKVLAMLDRRDEAQVKRDKPTDDRDLVTIIINTNPVIVGRSVPRRIDNDLAEIVEVHDE